MRLLSLVLILMFNVLMNDGPLLRLPSFLICFVCFYSSPVSVKCFVSVVLLPFVKASSCNLSVLQSHTQFIVFCHLFLPEEINMLEQSPVLQANQLDAIVSSHHVQKPVT